MKSNILNVSPYGQGVMVSFSISDEQGNVIPYTDNFNGIPCINTYFDIPTSNSPVQDLETNINYSILNRLTLEFTKIAIGQYSGFLVKQVNSDLIGQVQSVESVSIGSIVLTISTVVIG
jgi:hypothetical protein